MRPSSLLSAAAAASLLAAFAGPATAATDPVPAAGLASSTITMLDVAAGGRTISAGSLSLLSDALGSDAVARILATPLTVDGKAYGQRTVTPTDGPTTIDGLDSGAVAPALAGLVGITSPVLTGKATSGGEGPSSRVGADSFGGLSILGLPVALDGTLDAGSVVRRATGATGDKTLELTDLALPSIADVLAALGLDLKALPTDVLVTLLRELDILTPVVTTADKALTDATAGIQTQIDAAQAVVDKTTTDLTVKVTELAGKNSELAKAEADLAAKTAALQPLKAALASAQAQLTLANKPVTDAVAALNAALAANNLPVGTTLAQIRALPLVGSALANLLGGAFATVDNAKVGAAAAITSATAAVTQATTNLSTAQSLADAVQTAVTALQSTIATLQGVVNTLQTVLDNAIALLKGLLADVQPLINTLLAAVTAVLDGTPLVSIDSLQVLTESKVVSAAEGGQSAKVVGGEVVGMRVLGTDVLDNVLGTTRVDVLDLTGSTLTQVNGLLGELTGTLSSVLSTVPGFPALKIPAPKVELLTKQAGTGVTDGFGLANTAIRALSVTLPSITLPKALALPAAAGLPVFDSAFAPTRPGLAVLDAAGNLVSSPVTIALGTLTEQARFRAAVPGTGTPAAGTPTTGTPTTGTPTSGTPTSFTPGTQLPRTGASQALAVLGVALMAGAVAMRRRRAVLAEV